MSDTDRDTNTKIKQTQKNGITKGLFFLSGLDAVWSFISTTRNAFRFQWRLLLNGVIYPVINLFRQNNNEENIDDEKETERLKLDDRGRFESEMTKYMKTNDDILEKVRISFSGFYIMIPLLVISVFFLMYSKKLDFAMSEIYALAVVLFCLARMWYFSFSNYRLRNRAYFSVKKWFSAPMEWLPRRNFVKGLSALVLLFGLCGAMAPAAHADDALSSGSLFTNKEADCRAGEYVTSADRFNPSDVFLLPCKKDIFRNLLENIIPGVGPLSENPTIGGMSFANGKAALAEAFRIFLIVLLGIGTCTIFWHVLHYVVDGGREGDLVKSKWGGMWAWPRMCVGTSFLAPIGKGYCLCQIFCIYLVLWSGSFGNALWLHYVNGLANPDYSGVPVAGINDKVSNLGMAAICWSAAHNYQDGDGFPESAPIRPWEEKSVFKDNYYTSQLNRDSDATIANAARSFTDSIGGMTLGKFTKNGSLGQKVVTTWDFGPNCGTFSITRTVNNLSDSSDPAYVVNKGLQNMGINTVNIISAYIKELLTGNGGEVFFEQNDFERNDASHVKSVSFVNGLPSDRNSFPSFLRPLNKIGQSRIETSEISSVIKAISQPAYDHLRASFAYNLRATASLIESGNGGGWSDSDGNGQASYLSTFKKHAGEYGWAMAGSFYMNLSRMQNMTENELAQNGTLIASGFDSASRAGWSSQSVESDHLTSAEVADIYSKMNAAYNDFVYNLDSHTTTSSVQSDLMSDARNAGNVAGVTIDINTIGFDNPDSLLGHLYDKVADTVGGCLSWFIDKITGINNDGGGNKLQAMIEFGHNLVVIYTIVTTILVAVEAGSWATKFTGKGASLIGSANPIAKVAGTIAQIGGDALNKIAGTLMYVMTIILLVGLMHAYVLPMIPYIYFTTFILTELIFVITSLIAAPLWMLAHIRLDGGEEYVGQQQMAGYAILFNLLMRIPLGVLAFVMSFMIFNAMQVFMQMTFYPAVQGGQGHGSAGIFGMLVNLILMTFLNWQIALRCFGLINTVPNAMSQWMGLHQQMQDHESGSLISAVAAGMATHLRTGQEAMRAGSMAASGSKNKNKGAQQGNVEDGGVGGGSGNGGAGKGE